MSENNMTIEIKRRPWWVWLIGAIDLFLVIFFAQAGFASIYEKEPRASVFGFVMAVILLVAFYAFWRNQSK